MDNFFPRQFGLIVAYLLPGFIVLAGLAPLIPVVAAWLKPVSLGDMGIGPTVYALLSAMTMGMIVSCFRWLIVDHIHQWTGVPRSADNYANLNGNLDAVRYLIGVHYQYYQFYANTLVAILFSYLLNRFAGTIPANNPLLDIGIIVLCAGLFAGSRDALLKYRLRISQVLSQAAEKGYQSDIVTNGADHHEGAENAPKSKAAVKPAGKPQSSSKTAQQAKDRKAEK